MWEPWAIIIYIISQELNMVEERGYLCARIMKVILLKTLEEKEHLHNSKRHFIKVKRPNLILRNIFTFIEKLIAG